jgi:hypothetical protein
MAETNTAATPDATEHAAPESLAEKSATLDTPDTPAHSVPEVTGGKAIVTSNIIEGVFGDSGRWQLKRRNKQ